MNTKDFYYDLPPELIAQTPLENRSSSRLMVLDRENKTVEHKSFSDILDYINEGDLLVMNNTRVIPARLYGTKKDTGGKIEFLLLKRIENNDWEVILKPGRRARKGARFVFGEGLLEAEIIEEKQDGGRIVRFFYDGIWEEILDKLGEMPLPPYIKEKLSDKERYQTVYSKVPGSAAAPTAGLHFTEELLESLKEKGVKTAFVTLHVGLGTFRPVSVENVENHIMHSEYFELTEDVKNLINETKKRGKKVIAVGTTSVRTLETCGREDGSVEAKSGETQIFIYPGYKFKVADSIITNFHLPESTLLMLISAFYDKEEILKAYKEAVEEKYRFFSFGDAMIIL